MSKESLGFREHSLELQLAQRGPSVAWKFSPLQGNDDWAVDFAQFCGAKIAETFRQVEWYCFGGSTNVVRTGLVHDIEAPGLRCRIRGFKWEMRH
jgi:hypothetical protein